MSGGVRRRPSSSRGPVSRHVGGMLGLWSGVAVLAAVVFAVGGAALLWGSRATPGDPEVVAAGVPAGEVHAVAQSVHPDLAVYAAPAAAAAAARCTDEHTGAELHPARDPGPVPERRTVDGTEYGLVVQTSPLGTTAVSCAPSGGVEQVLITRWGGTQAHRAEGVLILLLAPVVLLLALGSRALGRHLRTPF